MIVSHSRIRSICIVFIFFLSVATFAQSDVKPKNIILMIGDGMGVGHITATRIERGPLNLERFKFMGMRLTSSADDIVTDSAAAGTALATGFTTNNDMVGQTPDGTPLKNLMEYAREAGKTTGITVTSILPHATPAAFSAHHVARYHYDIITEQQALSGLDVMIGGGLSNYYPKSFSGSRRKDEKHILNILREKMPVVLSIETLRKIKAPDKLAAILSMGHLPYASKRDYTLGELTKKAIEILNRNEKGFVLMVEGSQIDLAAHDNDLPRIIAEVADFDSAVKECLDFAEADGNTLVVVTADHETGGLTLPMRSSKAADFITTKGNKDYNLTLPMKSEKNDRFASPVFSSDNHTALMVPVYSYGPAAEKFTGMQDVTCAGKTLIELVK